MSETQAVLHAKQQYWLAKLKAGILVLCLLMTIAVSVLWILSYARLDMATSTTADADYEWLYAQDRGKILFGLAKSHDAPSAFQHEILPLKQYELSTIVWLFIIGDRPATGWSHGGITFMQLAAIPEETATWACVAPFWAVVLAMLIVPTIWLFRRLMRRRRMIHAPRGFEVSL